MRHDVPAPAALPSPQCAPGAAVQFNFTAAPPVQYAPDGHTAPAAAVLPAPQCHPGAAVHSPVHAEETCPPDDPYAPAAHSFGAAHPASQ